MSKTEKSFPSHQLRHGALVLVDVSGIFDKEKLSFDDRMKGQLMMSFGVESAINSDAHNPLHFGNMAWRPEMPLIMPLVRNDAQSMELTVSPSSFGINPVVLSLKKLESNGIGSYIITGVVARMYDLTGKVMSYGEMIQKLNEKSKLFNQDTEVDVQIQTYNVEHIKKLISKGTTPLRIKSEKVETSYGFSSFVHNEAYRYFDGYIPTNFDKKYMSFLLSEHCKYRFAFHDARNNINHSTFDGVRNIKKFREAFKRNVTRALFSEKDALKAEEFLDYIDCEMNMCEDSVDFALVRKITQELAKKWTIFSDECYGTRIDKRTRPQFDPVTGLSSQEVFRKEYNRLSQQLRKDENYSFSEIDFV